MNRQVRQSFRLCGITIHERFLVNYKKMTIREFFLQIIPITVMGNLTSFGITQHTVND